MSRRIQITLTDEQYERLCARADRERMPLAQLVRRAIDAHDYTRASEPVSQEKWAEALTASAGLWADRDFDGVEYVNAFRRGIDPSFIERMDPSPRS